jgi:hypothetical protein
MNKVIRSRHSLPVALSALVLAMVLAFSLFIQKPGNSTSMDPLSDLQVREAPKALSPEGIISAVAETIWQALLPRG